MGPLVGPKNTHVGLKTAHGVYNVQNTLPSHTFLFSPLSEFLPASN
jgi:hypothetical protein